MIGVGTCFEYALPGDHLTVDAPLGPTTLYATAKLALFQTLCAFFEEQGTAFSLGAAVLPLWRGRAPEPPGALYPQRLAAGEVAQLSAGTQIPRFLDVATAGAMIAQVAATRQLGAINICSGDPITVRQLAERTAGRMWAPRSAGIRHRSPAGERSGGGRGRLQSGAGHYQGWGLGT